MSTQIVRLANGDSIQVRTGVLRGSGPAGPPGPANSVEIGTVIVGDTADATISGDVPNQTLDLVLPKSTVPGPTGQINDFLTWATTTGNISIAQNIDVPVNFGTVSTDELGMVVTSQTFRPVTIGEDKVLSMNARVTFLNNGLNGTGHREARVLLNGSTVISDSSHTAVAVASGRTVLNVPIIHRFNAGDTFQVIIRHSGANSILYNADIKAVRIGAGPEGPPGPIGPAADLEIGSVVTLSTGQPAFATITGLPPNQQLSLGLPKGDVGSPGSAGSGYSEIHELDGTGGNTA